MIKQIVLVTLFLAHGLVANDTAKFLVLDNKTYNMIERLNILNGGINKNIVVSSIKLTDNDILNYYPEYFLFKGQRCNVVNDIKLSNSKLNFNTMKLFNKNEIKKEIKKIKLLQMLNDDNNIKVNNSIITKKTIKSLSLICKDKLIFRNNIYKLNGHIGKFIIKKLDFNNSILYIKE